MKKKSSEEQSGSELKASTIAQVAFILAAAGAVYLFVSAAQSDQRRASCTALCSFAPAYAGRNRTAPDFTLPDMNGKPVKLSDFRGKTVYLNFWTKTCRPCLDEMPMLADLARIARNRDDFVVLTVSTDEGPEAVRDALQIALSNEEPPFPILFDPESEIVNGLFGTKLYPETWIIDPSGVIRARFDGPREWSDAIALEIGEMVSRPGGCPVEFEKGAPKGRFAGLCGDDSWLPAPPMSPRQNPAQAKTRDERVVAARKALLEGVGAEIAASFPGVTRLAGQVVAALYLADQPRSMDELCSELGRSKSNIFANLRGLEGAGIIERRREPGARHDSYALRGKYPDVIIGAYLARLRRVVHDKQALSQRALSILGAADDAEADALRARLADLSRKYNLFADLIHRYLPPTEGPVDLERLLANVPEPVFEAVKAAAQTATRTGPQSPAPPAPQPPASKKR